MDEAHKARKAELEEKAKKSSLDDNEKKELEDIKKHEADVAAQSPKDTDNTRGATPNPGAQPKAAGQSSQPKPGNK